MSLSQRHPTYPELWGHPAALFVLFFTEMWERFSFYGMRALLVLFLTSNVLDGGWAWSRGEALGLYGTYTALIYVTPFFGGWIADRWLGYRRAVLWGAAAMTLGHVFMAAETHWAFYAGLTGLIVGNGLFKPNITSIVSVLYRDNADKKDSAYTIFYMGINAGAFLGILLCGYVGEKIGWSYGFALAGIFMLFGMLQFGCSQSIFGSAGLPPKKDADRIVEHKEPAQRQMARHIVRDHYIVIAIFALLSILFWAAFEQAGGSMTIFAKDYTQRVLVGGWANVFHIVNTLLVILPLLVITYVLCSLFRKTFGRYRLASCFLGFSFICIWYIVVWMLYGSFGEAESQIPASWFGVLNSFFIISLAPLFSKLWASRFHPPAAVKFGLGLLLLGVGFLFLAYGSTGIPKGAAVAEVSIFWLIFAYLFHTLGELFLSPVGLSYVSKLVPAKHVGIMFGVWFFAVALGNKLGGVVGSLIDSISTKHGMGTFFLIFATIPIAIGIVTILVRKSIAKLMHGVE